MKDAQIGKKEALALLGNVGIFRYVKGARLEELLNSGRTVMYDEGEKILNEGDESTHLFCILKGTANIQVTENTGEEVYVSCIGAGEIIGEAALFMNVKRTANVAAAEPIVLFEIERKKFLHYISRYSDTGIKVLMLMVYSLLRKLRESNHELAFERNAGSVDQTDIDNILNDFL